MSGVQKEEMYKSSDPVYGQTGQHSTATGAKAEEMYHGVKSAIPGTQEHTVTHQQAAVGTPTTTGSTAGTMGTTGTTTTGTTAGTTAGVHTAQNPHTGEVHTHSTKVGAKLDQGWQNLKEGMKDTTRTSGTSSHPTTF